MKWISRVFVAVLVAMAFVVPLAESGHCDDDHASDGAAECVCACHTTPASTCSDQENALSASESEFACSSDMLCPGRLSLTDIFRPPTAA